MSIRTLSVDFVFYGLLDLLQKSISIIMIPVYTRALAQNEYGDLDMIVVVTSFLIILVDLQFASGFSRFYYDSCAAGVDRRFVGTAVVGRVVGGLAVAAAFIYLGYVGRLEFSFLPSVKSNQLAWLLAVLFVPLTLAYDIFLLQARMLRWKRCFVVGSLSNVIVSCTLSAYFALGPRLGIVSVFLGLCIGKACGLLLLAWMLRQKFTLSFEPRVFLRLIQYTWPLIPAVWVSHSSVYGNRFFIFSELGPNESALLALCMKFVSILAMFAVAFHSAWQPIAMSYIAREDSDVFYARSLRLFIAGSLFSMFAVTALLDPLLILAPGNYGSVKHYFPLFAIGMVLSTCTTNIQLGHQIAKSTLWISLSAFIAVGVNVALLLVLLKPYGIFGAGVAWAASFGVSLLVMYYSAQRKHFVRYDRQGFAFLALGCMLLLIIGAIGYTGLLPDWSIDAAAAFLAILLPWLVLRGSEMANVGLFLKEKMATRGLSN